MHSEMYRRSTWIQKVHTKWICTLSLEESTCSKPLCGIMEPDTPEPKHLANNSPVAISWPYECPSCFSSTELADITTIMSVCSSLLSKVAQPIEWVYRAGNVPADEELWHWYHDSFCPWDTDRHVKAWLQHHVPSPWFTSNKPHFSLNTNQTMWACETWKVCLQGKSKTSENKCCIV